MRDSGAAGQESDIMSNLEEALTRLDESIT